MIELVNTWKEYHGKFTWSHCICFGGGKKIFVLKYFIFFEEQLQLLIKNADYAAVANIYVTMPNIILST